MSTDAPRKIAADASNPPGPIQHKRVSAAIGRLLGLSKTIKEISGIHGGESFESFVTPLFGFDSPTNPEPRRLFEEVAERYGWTLSKTNAKAMADDIAAAYPAAVASVPVEDKRRTPEEDLERVQRTAKVDAKRESAETARKDALASIMAKRPANATALIVAQLDVSDCDAMTDYWGHHSTRVVAIGWRTGSRESFPQLRKAAANFEPTAHMGPGCDVWTVTAPTDRDQGPDVYVRDEYLRDTLGGSFTVRTSESAIREAAAAAMETALAVEPPKACVWGDMAADYGFTVHEESVEHRENYSMGGGNFLKHGGKDSSGWKVVSCSLGKDGGGPSWTPGGAMEDGLPTATKDTPATASADAPAPVAGSGYTIETATNKRGDFSLVLTTERLDRETFEALRKSAQKVGGWYSRKWGKQPGGFGFDTLYAAQCWATLTFDQAAKDEQPEPTASADEPTPAPDEPGAAEKLHMLAALMASAEESVRFRGHRFEGATWKPSGKFCRVWTCPDCGMDVAVDPNPPANGIDVGGEAVALECNKPTPDDEPTVHLLLTRGGSECGAKGPTDADINYTTCPDCIQGHEHETEEAPEPQPTRIDALKSEERAYAARTKPSPVPVSKATLYTEALAAGLVVDHHESDLYLRATPEAYAMLLRHRLKCSTFTDQRDGGQLLDIPFAFDPFWEAKPTASEDASPCPECGSIERDNSGPFERCENCKRYTTNADGSPL